MTYYDPRKPKPWPVRLLNKCGVTDDSKATNIALGTAFAGMIITVIFYSQILSNSTDGAEEIDSALLQDMNRNNISQ